MGRFINADDPTLTDNKSGVVLSTNMYSYCNNDPINYIDPSGKLALTFSVITTLIYALIYICVAAFVVSIMLNPTVQNAISSMIYEFGESVRSACESLVSAIEDVLEKAKAKAKTTKTERHHIVAKAAKRAQPARDILNHKNVKIGINSSDNLISINYNLHKVVHTNAYYDSVNVLLQTSNGKNPTKSKTLKALSFAKTVLSTASTLVS